MRRVKVLRMGWLALALAAAACESDTVTPTLDRAVRIELNASSVRLESLGQDLRLVPRVLDAQGREMQGVPLEWSVEDGSVVQHVGDGLLRALANGQTKVSVRVRGGEPGADPDSYQGGVGPAQTVTVEVHQVPAHIDLTPTSRKLWAIGQPAELVARVTDARGNPIQRPLDVQWASEDEMVARIAAPGRVVATGDGVARVSATAENVTEWATIEVSAVVSYEACFTFTVQSGAAHDSQTACASVDVTVREGDGR